MWILARYINFQIFDKSTLQMWDHKARAMGLIAPVNQKWCLKNMEEVLGSQWVIVEGFFALETPISVL